MGYYRRITVGLRRMLGRPPLNEDGGAMVEFAVMAPLFFFLIFGIIEWGSIYWMQNTMVDAARLGARTVAVQGLSLTAANTTACGYLANSGKQFSITTSNLCPSTSSTAYADIKVRINVSGSSVTIFDFGSKFTGVTFNNEVNMRNEVTCAQSSTATQTATCTCNATVEPPTCL